MDTRFQSFSPLINRIVHHALLKFSPPMSQQAVATRCGYIIITLCVFVCAVMDFSAEDKASGVKFCTVVHGRPRQGISHFGELCSPRSPKSDQSAREWGATAKIADRRQAPPVTASARGTPRHVWIYGRPQRQTYLLTTVICGVETSRFQRFYCVNERMDHTSLFQ